ncbi:response regulator transcription factor [Paenibacillus sabuli]|uniref:response regulator transcription factor n=1 Tax=Paenibacillus sabuli TaxID=2772509 RepID=UPI00295B2DA2|nr:response regulator transcription factor [Paenibacillus sabuli]
MLLCDDEPFIVEGLYDMIDWPALGLEIAGSAGNGRLALDAMAAAPVDILVTDIAMPKMNGLELIAAARAARPGLKVIVLSAYSEFDYLREGMKLGIENYLLKPINVQELEETLRSTVLKLHTEQEEIRFLAYGTQLIKDNTLHRWLNGRMAQDEFEERADRLGLVFRRPWTAAAVLRCRDLSQNEADALIDALTAQFDEDAVVFRDLDGDLVVLAGFDQQDISLAAWLERIAQARDETAGSDRPGTLSGSEMHRTAEMATGYEEAKRAQAYFLVYPERQWMLYGEAAAFARGGEANFPVDWAEYEKLLLGKEPGRLTTVLDADFQRLRSQAGMHPAYLKEIAVELIVRFKLLLQEVKRTEEITLFADGLDRVQRAADLSELTEAVRDVALACIASLGAGGRSPVVEQVLHMIHEHYADDLSLKTLGAQFNVHPVYLGQLFIKEMSEPFTEYMNRYRIDRAKELLKTTHYKVQEISRLVGYWESGYFYKQFKKHVGISPTDFKNVVKK